MPTIRPHHPFYAERMGVASHESIAPIEASTLAQVVQVIERMIGCRVQPHDEPKWFRFYFDEPTEQDYALVDIHIRRGEETICPRQDLSFPLEASDIVELYPPIC